MGEVNLSFVDSERRVIIQDGMGDLDSILQALSGASNISEFNANYRSNQGEPYLFDHGSRPKMPSYDLLRIAYNLPEDAHLEEDVRAEFLRRHPSGPANYQQFSPDQDQESRMPGSDGLVVVDFRTKQILLRNHEGYFSIDQDEISHLEGWSVGNLGYKCPFSGSDCVLSEQLADDKSLEWCDDDFKACPQYNLLESKLKK